mgnify:FL=1
MAEERIQKIMSEQGLCSRRAAEQIIAEGRVKVNGHPVKVGDKMDPNRDVLHVDDERIYIQKNQQMYYLALYKPRGYVTTASDELGRKTVMDLVTDIPARLYPVGRLDKDSEGLLLMTNDGAFAQAVTHPSGGISKLYRVTVQPRADESQILKLSSGVVLDDGTKTMPCAINVVTDEPGRTVMEMTLKEGKNREIRRMCEAVGLEVIRLKRNAEGVVKLGMLQPGKYRELTKAEVNGLRAGMTSPEGMLVLVSSSEEHLDKVPSETDAFDLIDSVKRAKIARPERRGKSAGPLFTEKVTPGKVVRTRKAPLGAEEWTLSNGVKVFWRTVPEVIGVRKVGVTAVSEGGFARDSDVEGMHLLQNYIRTMGVKDLDRAGMRDLLFAHDASLMVTLGRTESVFSGASGVADFELLLQLLQ